MSIYKSDEKHNAKALTTKAKDMITFIIDGSYPHE